MKFTIDFPELPDLSGVVKQLEQQLPQIMQEEMLNVEARIHDDSVAGKRADGGALKPYSRSYIEAIDTGRIEGKAPGSHTPNLTATGTLLRSFKIVVEGLTARMFFDGSHPRQKKVSEKHAEKKRKGAVKAGHVLQHRGNRPVGATPAARGGGKKLGTGRKRGSGGGGGDTQNAVIAQGQYDMGRTGWVAFAQKDIERITKRVSDVIQKLLASTKK